MKSKHKKLIKRINRVYNGKDEPGYLDDDLEILKDLISFGYVDEKAFDKQEYNTGNYTYIFIQNDTNPFTNKGSEYISKNTYQRFRDSVFVQILRDLGAISGFILGILGIIYKLVLKN